MATLRLLAAGPGTGSHGGEVFTCTYTPDGAFVLSGGWDGYLRLWETSVGAPVTGLEASDRPISACAVSPDGRRWLSGSLAGLLAFWDPMTQQQLNVLLAHTRPISAIRYSPDGNTLATASWDRTLVLWTDLGQQRESQTLAGHTDVVTGCAFLPDGRVLVSWRYDARVRTWDVARGRPLACLTGHKDRVTACALSPDGTWAVIGSRDGTIKLWNLNEMTEVQTRKGRVEICSCFFLHDGETVGTIDVQGTIRLLSVAHLQPQAELATRLGVHCGALSPGGDQLVLGCTNGRARFIAVDDLDASPLLVTPKRQSRKRSLVGRLLGRTNRTHEFRCTCPSCRKSFELPSVPPNHPTPCPNCQRKLRFSRVFQ